MEEAGPLLSFERVPLIVPSSSSPNTRIEEIWARSGIMQQAKEHFRDRQVWIDPHNDDEFYGFSKTLPQGNGSDNFSSTT